MPEKRGRGRPPGFTMGIAHRTKIGNSKILKHLIEHAESRRDMGATQVTAALGLLKKVMPDLQATTISGDADNPLTVQTIERTIVRAKAGDSDR